MDWSNVDYLRIIVMFYQLFVFSFWRYPLTIEDPLLSKWCNAHFLQIRSGEETNLHLQWPEGEFSKFHFGVSYSFNKCAQSL